MSVCVRLAQDLLDKFRVLEVSGEIGGCSIVWEGVLTISADVIALSPAEGQWRPRRVILNARHHSTKGDRQCGPVTLLHPIRDDEFLYWAQSLAEWGMGHVGGQITDLMEGLDAFARRFRVPDLRL